LHRTISYLLCNVQRRDHECREIRGAARHARPDDPEDLAALGPQHGFGIARRIEQISEQVLKLNEGTVYTSLLRLQQQGWIDSGWGISENNRKAKFYSITKRGLKQLAIETSNWETISGVIGRVLRLQGQK
jgi:PadR family transcriptional regulator PadR